MRWFGAPLWWKINQTQTFFYVLKNASLFNISKPISKKKKKKNLHCIWLNTIKDKTEYSMSETLGEHKAPIQKINNPFEVSHPDWGGRGPWIYRQSMLRKINISISVLVFHKKIYSTYEKSAACAYPLLHTCPKDEPTIVLPVHFHISDPGQNLVPGPLNSEFLFFFFGFDKLMLKTKTLKWKVI